MGLLRFMGRIRGGMMYRPFIVRLLCVRLSLFLMTPLLAPQSERAYVCCIHRRSILGQRQHEQPHLQQRQGTRKQYWPWNQSNNSPHGAYNVNIKFDNETIFPMRSDFPWCFVVGAARIENFQTINIHDFSRIRNIDNNELYDIDNSVTNRCGGRANAWKSTNPRISSTLFSRGRFRIHPRLRVKHLSRDSGGSHVLELSRQRMLLQRSKDVRVYKNLAINPFPIMDEVHSQKKRSKNPSPAAAAAAAIVDSADAATSSSHLGSNHSDGAAYSAPAAEESAATTRPVTAKIAAAAIAARKASASTTSATTRIPLTSTRGPDAIAALEIRIRRIKSWLRKHAGTKNNIDICRQRDLNIKRMILFYSKQQQLLASLSQTDVFSNPWAKLGFDSTKDNCANVQSNSKDTAVRSVVTENSNGSSTTNSIYRYFPLKGLGNGNMEFKCMGLKKEDLEELGVWEFLKNKRKEDRRKLDDLFGVDNRNGGYEASNIRDDKTGYENSRITNTTDCSSSAFTQDVNARSHNRRDRLKSRTKPLGCKYLFIKNIDKEITQTQLENFFQNFYTDGPIRISLKKEADGLTHSGCGTIAFPTCDDATRCLLDFQRAKLGNRNIRLDEVYVNPRAPKRKKCNQHKMRYKPYQYPLEDYEVIERCDDEDNNKNGN